MAFKQWASFEAGYTPTGETVSALEPGYYDLAAADGQIFFIPVRSRTDELLEFPYSASKSVLQGISDFWDREDVFERYGLPFKRGILLYGPPGSGKTCTLQLVSQEVVRRGGISVTFDRDLFLPAYRALRDIQPDIPVVVLMEDFEALMQSSSGKSRILNMLDGVERLHKVVFIATTNYPEYLEPRIVNRPSRFDLLIQVDHPDALTRRIYLDSLLKEEDKGMDLGRYVEDTAGMSLAHVKELFVATHILGIPYNDSVKRLKDMFNNQISSLDGEPNSISGQYV